MFVACVVLAMVGVLVTCARRWLTKLSSRLTATLLQLLTFAGAFALLGTEHQHFPGIGRCIVTVSCAVIVTILLDAAGATKAVARGLGG